MLCLQPNETFILTNTYYNKIIYFKYIVLKLKQTSLILIAFINSDFFDAEPTFRIPALPNAFAEQMFDLRDYQFTSLVSITYTDNFLTNCERALARSGVLEQPYTGMQ